MRHHILVKFTDSATDLSQMRSRAEEIVLTELVYE